MTLDGVFHVQSWRVHHHLRGVLIELKELLDQIRVHQVITNDYLPEELLETLTSGLQILFCHFEEEALFGQLGKRGIRDGQTLKQIVELGKSLLDVPLVVPSLQLDVEEDGSLLR